MRTLEEGPKGSINQSGHLTPPMQTEIRYSSNDSIRKLQLEQSRVYAELSLIKANKVSTQPSFNNDGNSDEEEEYDEELAEFQRLELELKVYELEKKIDIVNEKIRLKLFERLNTACNTPSGHTDPSSVRGPTALSHSQSSSPNTTTSDSPFNNYPRSHDVVNAAHVVHHHHEPLPNQNPQVVQLRPIGRQIDITNRPLTLYLPKPNEQINLLEHIQALGHDYNLISADVQIASSFAHGYLWKACYRAPKKWKRRYFYFDRLSRRFAYYENERDLVKRAHEPKQVISFDDICDIYVDHKRTSAEEKRSTRRFVFVLATTERKYALASPKPEIMRVWIDVIFTATQATEIIV